MKAIETTGIVNNEGHLTLDLPLDAAYHQRVRVIVLIPEEGEPDSTVPDGRLTHNLDEDSRETVIEGIREGWQQALSGDVRPISELWDGLDVE